MTQTRSTRATRTFRYLAALIPLLGLFSVGSYVAWSTASGAAGFPLDDAWIHQTYARNLAETGQLAYLPGQPSAGSTSPAWSYLLSVGYMAGVDPLLWTYSMGAVSLAATAWFAFRSARWLPIPKPVIALLTGVFCAVEWHLVWAAASGMETMLFTALSLALLDYFFGQLTEREPSKGPASLRTERIIVGAVGIGLLGAILTLVRPEGLGLSGLLILGLLVFPQSSFRQEAKIRLAAAAVSLLSLIILLTPYVAFNLSTADSIFPNTFYAKQAEYQHALSFPIRFWRVLSPTLVGAQVLLVPGFCYAAYRLIRERRWSQSVPLLWWLAFLAAYAIRLPVNYQHGRYSIPTIPVLVVYGIWGTERLLRPHASQLFARVVSRTVPLAVALTVLVFWVRGAITYGQDVQFIEREMVAVSHWLNEHTQPEALIAVHDIGAVGYFTERRLLDLAGLISPQVIPFITDAERLADWMQEEGATYAVFFPDFSPTYAQLAVDSRFEVAYCSDYAWTRSMGHDNLCIYKLAVGN